MADAGPQDVVLLTVKAHQVIDLLPGLRDLFGPQTLVVTMINGIPWWYFHKPGRPAPGPRVDSVDPGGSWPRPSSPSASSAASSTRPPSCWSRAW
jgi:2-dehydropantoate 2-reductase